MELLVNGEKVEISGSIPADLKGLVELIASRENAMPGFVVSEIFADGEQLTISPDGLAETPIHAEDIKRLEIRIEQPEQLIKRMMEDAIQYCQIMGEQCNSASSLFRGMDIVEANRNFAEILDRLALYVEFVGRLQGYMYQMGGNRMVSRGFIPVLENLKDVMHQGIQAQTKDDWVLLADLLEYEFTNIFQSFEDAIIEQWRSWTEERPPIS